MKAQRQSGVLLHPTSLPGPHGSGDLGEHARYFVDWLVSARQTLWQFLPVGGVGDGNSPYMGDSAFAGNPALIDLQELQAQGWLEPAEVAPEADFDRQRVDFAKVTPWRLQRLEWAAKRFFGNRRADEETSRRFEAFKRKHEYWLNDYALFKSLSELHLGLNWNDWPADLARRVPAALDQARQTLAARIEHWCFVQWCFDRQWQQLRAYAGERGVRLIGDLPIFISLHSADVWANPELFELDAALRPTAVAGVPPDYFSPTGQRWGNPLYRWESHAEQGYAWWIARMRRSLELADQIRIDHFRGFAACWRIPVTAPDATTGQWSPGPGAALFAACRAALGTLPVIAEDLGIITPDVEALRRQLGFPGMRVLQFAWDGDPSNEYLPHRHERDTVVYTGTHDNDTTPGWWRSLDETTRHRVTAYFGTEDGVTALMRAALASVANTAILPMQDILGAGSAERMNTPGAATGCWEWRFDWASVGPQHAGQLAQWSELYGRTKEGQR